MTYEQLERILTIALIVSVTFFIGYQLYLFISVNFNSYKNGKAPVITTRATVAAIRKTSKNAIFNSYYNRSSGDVFYITFHADAGGVVEVCTDYTQAYLMHEGDTGELTYQREKLWKFIPDQTAS